jgi:transcriptional regulator with XRE-family HTH domain
MEGSVIANDSQQSVNDRLVIMVDYFEKGKKAAFARKADISPQAAQEILAGRRSEPSFKVLVRILQAYPQVHADWLVLGKGPMLQDASVDGVRREPVYATREQFEKASSQRMEHEAIGDAYMSIIKPELLEQVKNHRENIKAKAIAEQDALMKIYAVGESVPSSNSQLSARLAISEEKALQLVLTGKIRGSNFGEEGYAEGYRVTELAVREFLGEPTKYVSPWSLPKA